MKFLREYTISTHAPAGGATSPSRNTAVSASYFYSRPCGRGDTRTATNAHKRRLFLLTPLREGRHILPQATFVVNSGFLLTPLREGRHQHIDTLPEDLLISTHAPAGGATPNCPITSNPCIIFLLTPLREGRRAAASKHSHNANISTHAPAGGATIPQFWRCPRCTISTHAPAGGATLTAWWKYCRYRFLLTPLREGRPFTASTRARRTSFLLTPLREGRRAEHGIRLNPKKFLLTPLREGRRQLEYPRRHRAVYFYSRPCGRGDYCQCFRFGKCCISTHAPAGGAT